jgi:hypothetical protein
LNRYRYNYELREDFNKQQIKLRRLQKGGIWNKEGNIRY